MSDIDHSIRCEECKAYGGRHSFDCSKVDLAEAKRQVLNYREGWDRLRKDQYALEKRCQDKVRKAKAEQVLWHGKYMLVKHENNQLRKKQKN